jgi:hypothetical protein
MNLRPMKSTLKIYKPTDIIDFGKFKGKVIEQIIHEDSGYFIWLLTQAKDFFIQKEDLIRLFEVYPQLNLDKAGELAYELKRLSLASDDEKKDFSLEADSWAKLRSTPINTKAQREYQPFTLIVANVCYNDPLRLSLDVNNWRYAQLGVNEDAVPEIIVFCKSERILTCFSGNLFSLMGYELIDEPVQYYKFRVNMDDDDFGQVAQTLLQLGFVEINGNTPNQ